MAPSRKRAGGKAAAAAAARRQWKVGDLVLAKVKGFPAWPAVVSEPEKWGYSADWKKVVVHFFGTQQIAFCNPADVESFTEEKKQSLLTKRHAKGSDFVRAMKEITESYEKMKQQEKGSDSKSAQETICGSSGNSVELPQVSENLIGASLETQDETTLLNKDASAAEQMLALHGNSVARNGTCDSAEAKDLCKIATYSSRRRNERTQSQKFALQNHILPVQLPKSSSRLDLDTLKSSMLQCIDGDLSVDDMEGDAIRKRKKIQKSGRSDADEMVSPALNSRVSDEENSSEIATVESDNNFRNEGNGVDSGSRVERSDAGGLGCEGDLELNKGLEFQIDTMVKRKKRKPTRKRRTSDSVDPSAKVEAEGALGDRACDNCQRAQDSHERLDKRPCEENGDEHLPLVKRARVRMSRAFNADEEVTASLQVEERSSKDTLISAIVQRSPSVNHENNIVSGHDPSVAESKSSEMSAKLSGAMADVEPSHVDKPSDIMSPSRVCIQTVDDKQNVMEFFTNEFSKTHADEATQAQSNQLSGLPDGKACVPEVVPACYGDLQTRNCLNSELDPSGIKCPHQSDTKETPLDPDSMDLLANKSLGLCSSLDMTVLRVPDESSHPQQSQENESSAHLLVNVGDSLNEKCEKNGHCMAQNIQSQAAELSTSFCSVINNQEVDNMQETGNTLLKAEEESLGKELENDNQSHIIQNPALSVTEGDMIVEEAELQCETVYSNCEDDVGNREQEMSCEAGEQKELPQTTNIVSVSENLSSEKMSLSPANMADSPVRGTPHSNSVCRISTAESANVMQNSSSCSLNVQFGENKFTSDDSVKQEGKGEAGVTQVKKVISSDVQFTIESFETALGLLVRTKESIGRATRLAMDLVKFGVSAKAMEILAQSLESESNLQRRVDLFFLVDSIAQCSKGLNGDAGGIYLSSIQVMLPRLLAAAVPAGATTQDNRRQCLKVLRLWLERRILPESIIRHHIRELDSLSLAPACLYSRRSARTERALDDPVRDMEGMLVDEYGSNSTLQLPGFSMPAIRKDEDDGSDSDEEDFESVTPEHESRIFEEHITPSSITERHTRILEDVDGELEMEDVAPPWEAASSTITDQAENTESANYQLGQQHHPVSGTSLQRVTTSSVPPPSSPQQQQPPSLQQALPSNAQCGMSDSYSNGFDCSGYPSMLGNPQAGPPRMNPPMPVNSMRCQSPESSYNTHLSRSESIPDGGEGSNLHHRPYHLQPPPPPSHHYSYMEPDHHIKSRRDGPSYPHRSHYPPDFDERNYHDSHDRSRSAPNRNSWRYPPQSSYGPRYHDRHKGLYSSSSYNGHQRESGRFQNQRWSRSPRAYNNRHSYQYKPHSEGPVPVGMRDPGAWHQR